MTNPPTNRRTTPWRLGGLLVGLLLACALGAAGCRFVPGPSDPTTPPQASTAELGFGDPANPVPPPVRGAFLGAYVDPTHYVEAERIAAFEGFEALIGRPLDIFHTYHRFDDSFPSEADHHFAERGTLLLLSWAGADTREIAAGDFDELIRERARGLRELGAPVLLRWRWEMNRPNLDDEVHGPADYIAAWRHLRELFADEGADNVSWVWCPLVDPVADPDFGSWYPGDDAVDWICADGYARDEDDSWLDVFAPFLTWAAEVDRPILIGEFARDNRLGSPDDPDTLDASGEALAHWLADAASEIRARPQIAAVVHFESPRGASGHYDLAPYPAALAEFAALAHDPWFDAAA